MSHWPGPPLPAWPFVVAAALLFLWGGSKYRFRRVRDWLILLFGVASASLAYIPGVEESTVGVIVSIIAILCVVGYAFCYALDWRVETKQ